MQNSIMIAVTAQAARRNQLNTVAHNVANMNTAGYKRQAVLFASHVAKLDVEGERLAMAVDYGTYRDKTQGAMVQTNNPLDLAIEGEGFFAVETPDGLAYTRDGQFARNAEGDLVTSAGLRVLDAGGAPINIPAEAGAVHVARNGAVSIDGGRLIGRVGVFTADDADLVPKGNGLLTIREGEALPVEEPSVIQGSVEGSNVQAVWELTQLIELQRAYDRGKSTIDEEDRRLSEALGTLGKTR